MMSSTRPRALERSSDEARRVQIATIAETALSSASPLIGNASQPWLQAKDITLRCGNGARQKTLIEGLSFTVQPGECWAILGPNGSGKSTLLSVLAGVLPVARGDVEVEGRSLRDWPLRALCAARAWCPQFWSDPFESTVLETINLAKGLGRWWSDRAIWPDPQAAWERVVRELDLLALMDCDTRCLSGGERQRVAIGTALVQGTPMLLLDEPTAHLDLAHQQGFVRLMRQQLSQRGAVLLSTHDLHLAQAVATHVVLLDGRGAAAAGAAHDLLQPEPLSHAFSVRMVRVQAQHSAWFAPVLEHAASASDESVRPA